MGDYHECRGGYLEYRGQGFPYTFQTWGDLSLHMGGFVPPYGGTSAGGQSVNGGGDDSRAGT